MPYVNNRWLGGMLTNYGTLKQSIRKLEVIEEMQESGQMDLLTKKERLVLERKKEQLNRYVGGIRHMKGLPDMIFVLDAAKEKITVLEANKLGIPVIAPLDTNCNPDIIDYPIPGNDDAIRSIQLFCNEMAAAMNEGKASREDAPEDTEVTVSENEVAEMTEEVKEEAAASTEEA